MIDFNASNINEWSIIQYHIRNGLNTSPRLLILEYTILVSSSLSLQKDDQQKLELYAARKKSRPFRPNFLEGIDSKKSPNFIRTKDRHRITYVLAR